MIEQSFIVVSFCYIIPKQHIHNVQPDAAAKNTFPELHQNPHQLIRQQQQPFTRQCITYCSNTSKTSEHQNMVTILSWYQSNFN